MKKEKQVDFHLKADFKFFFTKTFLIIFYDFRHATNQKEINKS